jgi:hypothetical protein
MIDIKLLRKGLNITKQELAEMVRVSGIGRFRMALVEHGLLTLKPAEESILRMALAYTMHCRAVRMAAKLAQGPLVRSEPMTWDEYVKEHRPPGTRKEQNMKVIVVSLDLVEDKGKLLFPLSEPIPWNIELDDKAAEILATCPTVLESMIDGIRSVVALHAQAR